MPNDHCSQCMGATFGDCDICPYENECDKKETGCSSVKGG